MKKFTLLMHDTPAEREVEGEDLNDACQKAGLTKEDLGCLESFIDEDAGEIQVFGEADCKCIRGGTVDELLTSFSESNCDGECYVEDGITCVHDLARVGITYLTQNA